MVTRVPVREEDSNQCRLREPCPQLPTAFKSPIPARRLGIMPQADKREVGMEIKLTKDVEQRLTASVQRYLAENFEGDAGELKAGLFLRFCLAEIGPAIYHQAIADAQAYFQERAADLENVCFVEEGTYWTKGAGKVPQPPRRSAFKR